MIKKEKYFASILVIGDEVLSGRTLDTNSNHIAKKIEDLGISVSEIRVIPDNKDKIINNINTLREKNDYLFTTGGIGPTHDDITAESVAEAFNVKLEENLDAYNILKNFYKEIGSEFNDIRKRMARIPQGATLIENPISAAPGFKIENVFVFAGIPKVMRSMLDNSIQFLNKGKVSETITINIDTVEGQIADILRKINMENKDVRIGSYPYFNSDEDYGVNVVMKSLNKSNLSIVSEKLKKYLSKNSINYD